jgi:hypothetical protein
MSSTKPENRSQKTLDATLSSLQIGQSCDGFASRKKVALVDLGGHTGLSASLRSQLENGKLVPTLPLLARIAMVSTSGPNIFSPSAGIRRCSPSCGRKAEERME